jgi:hypothetical protein
MFGCAITGNFLYCISLLAKSREATYLFNSLPFLIGSGGTMLFDIVILVQYYVYSKRLGDEEVSL